MSDPIFELIPAAARIGVPIAVLGASFLGSAHCAGMCGGLVLSACRTRMDGALYHTGRLAAYSALGAAAGAFGQSVLSERALAWAPWLAAIAMAVGLIALGARAWQGQAPHFSLVPADWIARAHRAARGGALAPLSLGALSAVLPCGWLQSFVLAAASTRSATAGALLMACFWAGTVPALAALPWLARGALRPAARRAPRLTGALLIGAGLLGLGVKITPLFAQGQPAPCHSAHSDHSAHPSHSAHGGHP